MKRLLLFISVMALAVSCAETGVEDEAWRDKEYQTIFLAPEPVNDAYVVDAKGGELQILAFYQGEGPTVLNERISLVGPSVENGCSAEHVSYVRTQMDERKALYAFRFAENTSGHDLVWGVELLDSFTFRDKGFAFSRFLFVQKAE